MLASKKPWLDMVADSVVVATIALFSTSGELSSFAFWLVGFKAFGLAFALQLAIERGLKRGEQVKEPEN